MEYLEVKRNISRYQKMTSENWTNSSHKRRMWRNFQFGWKARNRSITQHKIQTKKVGKARVFWRVSSFRSRRSSKRKSRMKTRISSPSTKTCCTPLKQSLKALVDIYDKCIQLQENYHFMNFLFISDTVSPFVYTSHLKLNTNNIIDIPPKMKNTGYGEPTASVITGVIIMQIEHPNQFMNVATGTIFAGIISGTYNHTTGPTVKP